MKTQTAMQRAALRVLVAVVLLLAIAAYAFSRPSLTGENLGSKTQALYIFETDGKEIALVEVENLADSFAILRKQDASWTIEGYEELPFSQTSVSYLIFTVNNLFAERVIEEGAQDFGKYGLETPSATLKVTLSNGSGVELIVGDRTTVGDGWYAKIAGGDIVYTVAKSVGDQLSFAKTAYAAQMRVPEMSLDRISDLGDVVIGGEGSEGIALLRTDADQPTHRLGNSEKDKLDEKSFQDFFYQLSGLRSQGAVVLDASREKMKDYGLDEPEFTLSISYLGKEYEYSFGSPDGIQYFACCKNTPIIYSIFWDNISFLDIDAADLLQKTT